MCIRDRFGYDELIAEYMKANPNVKVEHKKAATANEARDNPVSYTHLRAHETVLDLVCRLLLAKKPYQPRFCNTYVHDTSSALFAQYERTAHRDFAHAY